MWLKSSGPTPTSTAQPPRPQATSNLSSSASTVALLPRRARLSTSPPKRASTYICSTTRPACVSAADPPARPEGGNALLGRCHLLSCRQPRWLRRPEPGESVPRWEDGTGDHHNETRPCTARPPVVGAAGGLARPTPCSPAPWYLAARREVR